MRPGADTAARRGGRLRAIIIAGLAFVSLATACSRESGEAMPEGTTTVASRAPVVTVSADQAVSPVPAWVAPPVEVTDANVAEMKARAAAALEAGNLFNGAGPDVDAAIPIYLALRVHAPDDASISESLARSRRALLAQGDEALALIDDDPLSLRRAHEVGAVARAIAPDDEDAIAYLDRLERVDQAQQANRLGEEELNAGRLGETGKGGAIALFRQALQLRPGDVRASQGLAAVESALIRRAESAANADDYSGAERWLTLAQGVLPRTNTVDHARERLAAQRASRIGDLRDRRVVANRSRWRPCGGRIAPTHRPGRALRTVPSRAGVHRRPHRRGPQPAARGDSARSVPNGRPLGRGWCNRSGTPHTQYPFRTWPGDVAHRGHGR